MNKRIKRYTMSIVTKKPFLGSPDEFDCLHPIEAPNGEWVKWEDVKDLIALQKHFEESGKLDARDEKLYKKEGVGEYETDNEI